MNFILHIDIHLIAFVSMYGTWTYALLFTIIFCETGIVILPFFPGDSLLFAVGALAASVTQALNVHFLFILLAIAAFVGDTLNYFLGKQLGAKLIEGNFWFCNKKHIERTHAFYERFGTKTIILARFIPIIRTIAPFIAGIGYMNYRQFFIYNLIGALLWIGILMYAGYLFGNIPLVQQHFGIVIMGIIAISILPVLIEVARRRNTAV